MTIERMGIVIVAIIIVLIGGRAITDSARQSKEMAKEKELTAPHPDYSVLWTYPAWRNAFAAGRAVAEQQFTALGDDRTAIRRYLLDQLDRGMTEIKMAVRYRNPEDIVSGFDAGFTYQLRIYGDETKIAIFPESIFRIW